MLMFCFCSWYTEYCCCLVDDENAVSVAERVLKNMKFLHALYFVMSVNLQK